MSEWMREIGVSGTIKEGKQGIQEVNDSYSLSGG